MNKKFVWIIVALLFSIHFGVYLKGAFNYLYLEDDDSYGLAKTIQYITEEHKLTEPYSDKDLFGYLDPRPPLYVLSMSFFHMFFPMDFYTKVF
jgi:asparagine N-glycosylation enzyme membrane subunit Stt3